MTRIPNVRVKVIVEIDDIPTFEHLTELPLFASTGKGKSRDDAEKRLAELRFKEQIYHFIASLESKKTEFALREKIHSNQWPS